MCARNSVSSIPKPCKHLSDYKLRCGSNGFNDLQNLITSHPNGRPRIDNHESEIPRCSFCNGYQKGRIFMCLICSSVSCSTHLRLHSQSQNGHDLAVDIERAELYCCLCGDQVYDSDFDGFIVSGRVKHLPGRKNGGSSEIVEGRASKKMKMDQGIVEDLKKARLLISSKDQRQKSCYPLGLRGLNNLGSTCFMNSVLQALIHAPPLKNYFFSNRHSRDHCQKQPCLLCEIGDIFSAMFSGDHTPYSPARLLYSWWRHETYLASYEEKDAHEFLISVLNGIHEINEDKAKDCTKDKVDCQCIAHRAFSGVLRSDVLCTICGFTSTTDEPCFDISLNMPTSNISPKGASNKSAKPNEQIGLSTLSGCLEMYTRLERLGSEQKFYCSNCQELRGSLKQMSIKRLPLVLCLHIKRVSQSRTSKTFKKDDQYLQFPFSLDMTAFLSSSIVRKRFGNRIFSFETQDHDTSTSYEIFAVISHMGMLHSGHYVTYLRVKNQWYKCDDAWINEVDEETVRASKTYMLFYVQKRLDFNILRVSPRRSPSAASGFK